MNRQEDNIGMDYKETGTSGRLLWTW